MIEWFGPSKAIKEKPAEPVTEAPKEEVPEVTPEVTPEVSEEKEAPKIKVELVNREAEAAELDAAAPVVPAEEPEADAGVLVTPQEEPEEASEENKEINWAPDPDHIEDEFMTIFYDWVRKVLVPKNGWFRAPGNHVSQIYKMCSRKLPFAKAFPDLVTEDTITDENILTWDFGTATHSWWQDRYFGPMGWMWGDWECSRCRWVEKDCHMPKDPCSRCEWCETSYLYVQPTLSDTEPEPVKCRDACRWPEEGGFEAEGRDCNHCRQWGSWGYLEPGVHVPELDLTGHCDGILWPPDGQKLGIPKMGLEMKTMNKKQFDKLTKPLPQHVQQFNTYMHFLGLKGGVIVYIHKGEFAKKKGDVPRIFYVDYDPEKAQEAIKKIEDSVVAEKTDKLGTRVCYSKDSWQAKRCAFYSVCYLDGIKEQVEEILSGQGSEG